MADKDIDIKKIEELIEIMKQNGLEELEIKQGNSKVFLKRCQPKSAQAVPMVISQSPDVAPSPVAQGADASNKTADLQTASQEEGLVEIKSPIVGTFYAKPSPDSDLYVEVGSAVDSQTVVCIIEAMKVMNEIKAETSGTIVEILVSNGQAVEYGQVLFRVRPS